MFHFLRSRKDSAHEAPSERGASVSGDSGAKETMAGASGQFDDNRDAVRKASGPEPAQNTAGGSRASSPIHAEKTPTGDSQKASEQTNSAQSASGKSAASPITEEQSRAKPENIFGDQFSSKEQKTLFLYMVIGIVLVELAVTVGAVIYSITNAQPSPTGGAPRFRFPWIGYTVAVILVPVLAMLLINLVKLGFSRDTHGASMEHVPQRMQTFFALVRGAPTIILFAGFVLMAAAIYYLDGVMELLLKLGEHFHVVAIWIVGGFAFAWTVSYVVRAYLRYKAKQMEAEYAFRHEVLERTGMVILDTKYAPTTDLRMLPPVKQGAGAQGELAAIEVGSGDALPSGEEEISGDRTLDVGKG